MTRIDSLPLEILLQICEYIDQTHRPSLKSLALVNKALLEPCAAQLFRTIHIHISSPEDCQETVKQWTELLSQRNCLEDVRTVEIHGFLANDEDRADYQQCQYCQNILQDESWMERCMHSHSGGLSLEEENKAFKPIATFLEALPSATDLIWRCPNVTPQCVLEVTNSNNPTMRLHVTDLKLFHIKEMKIGSRELAVLRSPSLYRLQVRYLASEINGVDSDLEPKQATLKTIVSIPPNLKQLRIIAAAAKTCPLREEHSRDLDEVCSEAVTTRLAPLERLELRPKTTVDEDDFHTVHQLIDPAALRCLILGSALSTPMIRWASRHVRFPNLQELTFAFDNQYYPQPDRSARAVDTHTWLVSLPRLGALCVSSPLYMEYALAIGPALSWHGQTLRKFVLSRPLYGSTIAGEARKLIDAGMDMLFTLSRTCPVLEELSIPLQRRQSNRTEMGSYALLASFPKLVNISLQFDCACWGLLVIDQEPENTPEDREQWWQWTAAEGTNIKTGRVRRALMNAALDQSLAEQIWHAISSRRSGSALESLQVTTFNDHAQEIVYSRRHVPGRYRQRSMDLLAIFQEFERTYVVSKSAVGNTAELDIREINKSRRERERRDVCHPDGPEMKLFRKIWPETAPGSNWRDDWHSFAVDAVV
ncbi:hypothetical protein PRZ48_007074 [Zasmidium cellare]|uniref:F-box domain-containing protein n=1 Tax=Zasmidium cellare TaxID=395010 RepID=A0ABR0EIL6_ZASCE|nr:hypothetical protein PRZ48_007074 [Zasmidium cellare]